LLGTRTRAAHERQGRAEDLGGFRIEAAVVVERVAHAPQAAADDLLAQKLRAEGADAENMRYRVGVPAFGELLFQSCYPYPEFPSLSPAPRPKWQGAPVKFRGIVSKEPCARGAR